MGMVRGWCPAGRLGDRGDREIVYVPDVYVPFLALAGLAEARAAKSSHRGKPGETLAVHF